MPKYRTLGTNLGRQFRNDINANFADIERDITNLDSRVDNIVADAGSSNTEIVDARYDSVNDVTYTVLKDRLDDQSNKIGILTQITDMLSPYYARKNRQYLGEVSRKLRYGENVTITFYGDSNSMRSNSRYQVKMLEALNGVYGGKISRIDRAYAGDSAKAGYERWTTTHNGDISIICYGTNDSSTQYGYPEATKVRDYIYWLEKLIIRELEWGKAVILVSPIPTRNDKRWETKTKTMVTDPYPTIFRADSYVFGNLCKWIAEKYSAPFIDSREILSSYEDEIFANANGNSLGTATSPFGDPVHLTDEGLEIWGKRVAGIFIGDSLLRPQKATANTAFATRKGEDPFTTNAPPERIRYYTPYAWGVGDNIAGKRALELFANEEITYAFYVDTEDLIVYPNIFVFANSIAEIKLDYGIRQPLGTLDEEQKNGANYGYQGASTFTIDTTSTRKTFNITKGQDPITKDSNADYVSKGIKISSKGWHTINIKCLTGYVSVSGIRFRNDTVERIANLELANNNNAQLTIKDLNNVDLNTITTPGIYYTFGTCTNKPPGVTKNGLLKHYEKTSDHSIAMQEFYPYNDTTYAWFRLKITGVWQNWVQIK